MDLGIAGKTGLVTAASRGFGRACAQSLAREGVKVTIVARTPGPLQDAADEISTATGTEVSTVVADIVSEAGRAAVLAACPDPDILVNNSGGPPHGDDFQKWDRDTWIAAMDDSMLTPIFFIKAALDGMIERRFGRIVNITSNSVKAPIPNMGLSNGARTGLTGFVAGLARQTVRHNVTINNLLPGRSATDRLWRNLEAAAKKSGRTVEEVEAEQKAAHPAGRFGDPAEMGDACAFLSGVQAGYITGQNLLVDGGKYPGTF